MKNKSLKYYSSFIVLVLLLYFGWQYFHRVPERVIPTGNAIVSPANGKVIYIGDEDKETVNFFKNDIEQIVLVNMDQGPYTVVVIEMNVGNVHVQRAPISGKIIFQEYMSGLFRNAVFSKNKTHLANVNEKTLTIFENENNVKIGVIQVAGVLARTIESWKKEGDILEKGEPYGMIKLGSQVVVILPNSIKPKVKIGEIVIDGETILGNLN